VKNPFNGDREKDGKILEMYHHGHTYDQIAKELHVSPNYIASVIMAKKMRVDKEKRDKRHARALQLFSQGDSLLDVCIKLAISTDDAYRLHNDYLELTNRYKLVEMHEELGTNNLANMINLYETMKNARISREDIIKLSKDYFTIPDVRNDLESLLDDARRQEDKREQYISDWQELNNRNMDLKRENRILKEENRELEKKNRDLKIKNRNLQKENSELDSKARRNKSLEITLKDPKSAPPCLLGYTDPGSSNKTYTSGDQELPYLYFDLPSILPTKSSKSLSIDGGNGSPVSSCQNLPENETKSIDPLKDLAPSNTRSPRHHNLFKHSQSPKKGTP
jgi:DNA-binding CsgD family transcriptional regulator